ncbi:MAG TPA: hypothetical protein G4O11_07790 [Anaerolineae bacterium]|nr:hypothetical protein [Anaerolineae bacterium]
MREISLLDRILLLVTGLLSAYQIAVGIEGLGSLAVTCYTIAFGVLLVAGLILIILGFEALESPLVVVVAALIPLSLSLGLISQYIPTYQVSYMVFAVLGFLAIVVTRYLTPGKTATIALALVHGTAGLVIFALPIVLSLQGKTRPGFFLVGIGGGLIGIGGLLLTFLRAGRTILSARMIYTLLPILLLMMTAAFVVGLAIA